MITYYSNSGPKDKEYILNLLAHPPEAIAVDVETVSLAERMPLGFAIAFSPDEAIYFPTYPEPTQEIELLKPCLFDPARCKIAHNILFDLGVLPMIPHLAGFDRSNLFDTNTAARLLGRIVTDLPFLASENGEDVGIEVTSAKSLLAGGKTMLDIDPVVVADKCQRDARATYALYLKYKPEIESQYDSGYFDVEMKIIPILIDLSMRGIAIDQTARQEMEDKLDYDVRFYRHHLEEAGIENPGSTQQVGYILGKRGNFLPFTKSKKQLSTRESVLQFLDDPVASAVISFREKSKLLNTYIKPMAEMNRFYTEYYLDTVVGRLNSRNRNIQNIPPECRHILLPDRGCFTSGDYRREHLYILAHMCLIPSTKVLMANLTWQEIGALRVGDKLVGIDEYPLLQGRGAKRKLRLSSVISTTNVASVAYTIEFDNGSVIIAGEEHPWLRTNRAPKWQDQVRTDWVRTKDLKPGNLIKFLGEPWPVDGSREAGYLAGLLDGEGSLTEFILSFVQRPGLVADEFIRVITKLDHPFCQKTYKDTYYRMYKLYDILRLLGSVRPTRLLHKLVWDNKEPKTASVAVKSIYRIGSMSMVDIQTTTRTFIAEGFFTHNSGDRDMLAVLYDPDPEKADLHQHTADRMRVPRRLAKTLNFAVAYGATAKTVSEHARIKDIRFCGKLLDDWLRTYRGAADWVTTVQRSALQSGWSEPTLFGRRIAIPEEYNRWGALYVEGMKRKAVNYPIIGSDGEIIKRAIILCNEKGLGPPIMAVTIHDSIDLDGDYEFPVEELEHIPSPLVIPFDTKQTIRWE